MLGLNNLPPAMASSHRVDAFQRTVAIPQVEIIVHRALGRAGPRCSMIFPATSDHLEAVHDEGQGCHRDARRGAVGLRKNRLLNQKIP